MGFSPLSVRLIQSARTTNWIGTVIAMNESPDALPQWISSRLRDGRNRIVHNADPDVREMMSDGGER